MADYLVNGELMPSRQRKSKGKKPELTGFVGVAGPSPFTHEQLVNSLCKNFAELRREDEARAARIRADVEACRGRIEEVNESRARKEE